jgi:hypothetical protein
MRWPRPSRRSNSPDNCFHRSKKFLNAGLGSPICEVIGAIAPIFCERGNMVKFADGVAGVTGAFKGIGAGVAKPIAITGKSLVATGGSGM